MSIIAGLFFNGIVQAVFCVIANAGFMNERFPTVDEIKLWRYSSAHDSSWVDRVTGASLASRVCSEDASLVVSTSQVNLHLEISMYLAHLDLSFFGLSVPQGPVLCCLSILIWFLVVMTELHRSAVFFGVVSCSYACNWASGAGGVTGGSPGLVTVTLGRLAGMTLVSAVRVGIALSLF